MAKQLLSEWLKGSSAYLPITDHAPRIGIHDTSAIEHVRTYLWDLADYRVDCVQAGVIWLAPRNESSSILVVTAGVNDGE